MTSARHRMRLLALGSALSIVGLACAGSGASPATVQTLGFLEDYDQLATEFDVVEAPRPGTLRLRCAVAMKTPSLLGVEVEILDAASGARLVAAVDERPVSGVDHERARAQQEAELARWASVIRTRLAAFRSFDAARRARGEDEAP